jgi:hypothetical protein
LLNIYIYIYIYMNSTTPKRHIETLWNRNIPFQLKKQNTYRNGIDNLEFSPWTLETLQIGPWNIIRDSGQNWGRVMEKFQYSYEFMTFQFGPPIWQNYNLTPTNLIKFHICPWSIILDSGQNWGWIMGKIPV